MPGWFARRSALPGRVGARSGHAPRGLPRPAQALLLLAVLLTGGGEIRHVTRGSISQGRLALGDGLVTSDAGLSASSSKRRAGDPRLVILLSVDTLASEALAVPTDEHPALGRLAAASLRFTNALSTASWTLPAHASLMTGLYPDHHHATDPRAAIAAD